mmetsp:Transcript_140132/g.390696  ORF Transcript_140132/g.390696 Transcript_140132/m.390696 type:complete len:232 (-) Transcript_140132:22-717(-)
MAQNKTQPMPEMEQRTLQASQTHTHLTSKSVGHSPSRCLVSITCSSAPPGARHHVHSSTSTVPRKVPSIKDSPRTDTCREALLNFTATSFFVKGASRGKRTCISSPFCCQWYFPPSTAFSLSSFSPLPLPPPLPPIMPPLPPMPPPSPPSMDINALMSMPPMPPSSSLPLPPPLPSIDMSEAISGPSPPSPPSPSSFSSCGSSSRSIFGSWVSAMIEIGAWKCKFVPGPNT